MNCIELPGMAGQAAAMQQAARNGIKAMHLEIARDNFREFMAIEYGRLGATVEGRAIAMVDDVATSLQIGRPLTAALMAADAFMNRLGFRFDSFSEQKPAAGGGDQNANCGLS